MASLLHRVAEEDSALRTLLLITLVLSLSLVGVSAVAVVLAVRSTQEYFIPPTGPGYVRPGEINNGYVQGEASQMALLRHNWTAETLPHAQTQFKALLAPPVRKTFEGKIAPEELRLVKQHKITWSQFVVTGTDLVQCRQQTCRVLVHGIRSLWMGNTVSDEDITVDVVLAPITTNGHAAGLQIVDMQDTHPLKLAGR
jgi:hypothetical protein